MKTALILAHLVERDLPNVEDYVMYRVLCYIWKDVPDKKPKIPKAAANGIESTSLFIHQYDKLLVKMYQFFNENDQNSYYSNNYTASDSDHANFISKTLKYCFLIF